jgi:hypothetical protein
MIKGVLHRVILPHKMRSKQHKIHMYMDQAPCNKSAKTKRAFTNQNVIPKPVPSRMTCLLQPADVAWFHQVKSLYRRKWEEWMINAPKSYTRHGNLRSPGYSTVLKF